MSTFLLAVALQTAEPRTSIWCSKRPRLPEAAALDLQGGGDFPCAAARDQGFSTGCLFRYIGCPMTLSIKDPETDRLARQLAHLKGRSITDAVREALAAEIAREQRLSEEKLARLEAIVKRAGAILEGTGHSLDHGDLLYDEDGLPG
jgi:antitoxin VapB